MPDVIFNEEESQNNSYGPQRSQQNSNSGSGGPIVKLIMSMGAKSEQSANAILTIIAILFIILAIVIYFVFVG